MCVLDCSCRCNITCNGERGGGYWNVVLGLRLSRSGCLGQTLSEHNRGHIWPICSGPDWGVDCIPRGMT